MLLSERLVRLIQNHSEGLAAALVEKVRVHPDLSTLAKCSPVLLGDWCAHQIGYLNSSLLAEGKLNEETYNSLGRLRFEESIPLHEAVLRLFLLKDTIVEFVHDQGFPLTALDLYAQEEIEQRVSRFFDAAVYHVVCGYEQAMREPARRRA
jgi:hypothetical protein